MVNDGSPAMLVRLVSQAKYKPMLATPWGLAISEAFDTLPRRLRYELDREMGYAIRMGKNLSGNKTSPHS